jgi:hypothetical protein
MLSPRAAILAGLFLIVLPCAALGGTRSVVVTAPGDARITVALSEPVEGDLPPLLTVYVAPQPDFRALRRNRVLFQTWTGFRKQYSGRRYPF